MRTRIHVGRSAWVLMALWVGLQATWGFYNPQTGRWLNRDPIGEWGGLNLYALLANASVDQVDTGGLRPFQSRWPTLPPNDIPWPIPPISFATPPRPTLSIISPPSTLTILGMIARLILDAKACYDNMQDAKTQALNWLRDHGDEYVCCVNGVTYDIRDFPGPVVDSPIGILCEFGVGHCLAGYYARMNGASSSCLAAANLAHEIWEVIRLGQWTYDQNTPLGWALDTVSDMAETCVGYGSAQAPEDCVPSECVKLK